MAPTAPHGPGTPGPNHLEYHRDSVVSYAAAADAFAIDVAAAAVYHVTRAATTVGGSGRPELDFVARLQQRYDAAHATALAGVKTFADKVATTGTMASTAVQYYDGTSQGEGALAARLTTLIDTTTGK